MENIDIYNNSSIIFLKKTPQKIISWIIILVASLFLMLVFMCCFKYKKYLKYESYIHEGYVEFYVDKSFFDKRKSDTVLINDKKYDYDVISISEFSYDYGQNNLWKIVIKVDLEQNMLIENNYFQLKFLESNETTIQRLIKKIKKGLN